jgi:hypothetical protein
MGFRQLLTFGGFCCRHHRIAFGAFLGLLGISAVAAQQNVELTEITPTVVVFSTAKGNVVVSVGPDGALLVGTPSASSTPEINRMLASRTSSAARYVVIGAEDPAASEGDAGWGRLGALVAMQENALRRIGGDRMGAPQPLSPRFVQLGLDRPRLAFSEVLSFDLNGEAIHIVRQSPGYSDADTITHFHVASLVYFGEAFPGDGYPMIDGAQSGTLDGLLKTLSAWADGNFHIVPARGKVTDGEAVKAYCGMIVTVRARIQRMFQEGKTEAQVEAQYPTRDFDERWGRGRVAPEAFVAEVYRELNTKSKPLDRSPVAGMK